MIASNQIDVQEFDRVGNEQAAPHGERGLWDVFHGELAPLRRLAPKTVACYEVSLRHLARHLGRPPVLSDLNDLQIAKFVADRERETCTATAARDRVQICAIWRYAARKRLVADFPELPPIRVPKRVPRAYSVDDVRRLVEHVRAIKGAQVAGIPAAEWWESLILCLWETAERITATTLVKWRDVDVRKREILFRAENRKNRTRDIRRALSPRLAEMLSARTGRPEDFVWPWSKSDCLLWADMRSLCERAGISYLGFHGIRKAAASYFEAAGHNATKLLDHGSRATTVESYLDPGIVKGEPDACDVLPTLFQGNGATEAVAPEDETQAPEEAALRAGFLIGKRIAERGGDKPTISAANALAFDHGHASHLAWFRNGVRQGWVVTAEAAGT